jgi:thioredoxin-related protein
MKKVVLLLILLVGLINNSFCQAKFSHLGLASMLSVVDPLNFNSTDSLPFKNIKLVLSYQNLSQLKPITNKNTVLIYTIQSCKPCINLAKKLEKLISEDSLLSGSIIFFNPSVVDLTTVKNQVREHYNFAPFYIKNNPNNLFKVDAYPFIAFHDSNGELINSVIGNSWNIENKITKHLKKTAGKKKR